jgi:hypothetical protein
MDGRQSARRAVARTGSAKSKRLEVGFEPKIPFHPIRSTIRIGSYPIMRGAEWNNILKEFPISAWTFSFR